ncbi:aminomethyl-transferring glycine dehydrogenase [Pseudidiomarina andamanensis]|uniref:Glycine dehydrogenase (decarboxylating) n=1 Tax=Pseudidiomarina andamanensis TaxID=1940690 RepID=A0AA92ESL6_9GAMM|nr:aminomethyl-transferring glycine dehydrogenase [Pseudidiomarina andamanensis]MDS0219620.1 aminomethyl-transferring glycine dehydrogenase [Pseudidiomarina andamanensis]QGT95753.1 aminomethyl-transferring glycine dehydrogenase [Pseudidiomarina andamanensis]
MTTTTLKQLENHGEFIARHIGPSADETKAMLAELGVSSLEVLTRDTVPGAIRRDPFLSVGEPMNEREALAKLKGIASKNKVYKSFIGMGYYDTLVPNVILRNVLENPGWYTAYTPYQPEIAQGRLEAILNFQQMTMDLTGLELASASLLDEATAAAEAMAMSKRVSKSKSNTYYVADNVFPQTIDVVKTRAEQFGFDVIVGPAREADNHDVFGALLQYPDRNGEIHNIEKLIADIQANKGIVAVAADIMSLVLLKSPGEMGADMVLGSAQRFGVPMGYGGPHAAFFATRDKYKRSLPGRIIGVSKDSRDNQALRMAMQTREQHIRREKANSNICTAQVLLANMASFYAVYHGPQGLKTIASRINRLTDIVALGLKEKGVKVLNNHWFDTLTFKLEGDASDVLARADKAEINLRVDGNGQFGVSLDEAKTRQDVDALFAALFGADHGLEIDVLDSRVASGEIESIPAALRRESAILEHPVFNSYHSETEMLRYIKQLENKDLSLNHSMISLGSCTMKLNATAEMIPVTWPEFGQLHPFCPADQAQGYAELLSTLSEWLVDITGYDVMSMQPNSGAQGEYAGLLAIQKYHQSRGDAHRNICLIPSSAHGTNPASAQMMSMNVVVVDCDKNGNVDLADLKAKAEEAGDNLSCIMVTYPSTHGVYEEGIKDICDIVHAHGGQVYLDGANMNAQVGVTSPGYIGADVSHLNLHKTFCIPHGGGGPGMGPIGVKKHLAPFLPNHSVVKIADTDAENGAVSAAPFGSASILPISWMYIVMMGSRGLREATEVAIMNANYIAKHLSKHYPILYKGRNDRVAHECIIDLRPLKDACGVTEMDVAKRLQDYGFHSPTMSFPVAGTLMVEPTESESKAELDRFIEAMINIREEAKRVEAGEWPEDNNPLHNAPHTLADIVDANWERPYSRELAAYPVAAVKANKFWPSVNRIDDVYGDRNLMCSCPAVDTYR